jgi:hypothetical protein
MLNSRSAASVLDVEHVDQPAGGIDDEQALAARIVGDDLGRRRVEDAAGVGADVGMFLWGRWRHDMVAMASLLACVLAPAGACLPRPSPASVIRR